MCRKSSFDVMRQLQKFLQDKRNSMCIQDLKQKDCKRIAKKARKLPSRPYTKNTLNSRLIIRVKNNKDVDEGLGRD